jgi:hypothetical protein
MPSFFGSARLPDDVLDKYFEAFKHVTTLSVALGVVVLVVFRDSEGSIGIIGSVILLTGTFCMSLVGLFMVVSIVHDPEMTGGGRLLWWLLMLSVVFLIGTLGGLVPTAALNFFLR